MSKEIVIRAKITIKLNKDETHLYTILDNEEKDRRLNQFKQATLQLLTDNMDDEAVINVSVNDVEVLE